MNVLIVKIIVYDLHVNNHVAFLLNYPVYHIKNLKKIDWEVPITIKNITVMQMKDIYICTYIVYSIG